jgi:hypothetical protein
MGTVNIHDMISAVKSDVLFAFDPNDNGMFEPVRVTLVQYQLLFYHE